MTHAQRFLISLTCSSLLASAAFAQAVAPAPAPAAPAPAIPTAPVAAPAPVAAAPVAAQPVATAPVAPVATGVTKEELPALVRQALLDNPEILVEVAERYRNQREASERVQTQAAINTNKDMLFNDGNSPSVGNPAADVTIVEFFDYHCGYCHQIMPALAKLLDEDKNLRIVFKEFPILSEDSVLASKVALAVNRVAKDKYFAFHQELMKSSGRFTEEQLLDIAKKVGVNKGKVKAELAKPELGTELDNIRKIAEELGIRGTPALIIGDQLYPGAMSYDEMKKEVAKARGMNASQ